MTEWGRKMYRHARRGGRRQAGHQRSGRHQSQHPHSAGQLLLRRLAERRDVREAAIRWAIRWISRHPWNQTTIPRPQKRDFNGNYTWVMSPRWYDKRTGDHLALDTGGGPIARLWSTALAGLVDIGYVKATGHSVQDQSAQDGDAAGSRVRVEDSAVEQHDRARPRSHLLPGLRGGHGAVLRREGAGGVARRPHQDLDRLQGAGGSDRLRLPRSGARRALASRGHPRRQDRQLSSVSANALECESRATSTARPGPYEDAVQNTPIFEENGPDNFKGIDIMRTVRSFDPCLPCGVHMYLGDGKVIEVRHSPMFGVTGHE